MLRLLVLLAQLPWPDFSISVASDQFQRTSLSVCKLDGTVCKPVALKLKTRTSKLHMILDIVKQLQRKISLSTASMHKGHHALGNIFTHDIER